MIKLPSLFILILILLFSCSAEKEEDQNITAKIINPAQQDQSDDNADESVGIVQDQNFLVPMIEIPIDEQVLEIHDINLDTDTEEEQIILTRSTLDEQGPLKVYIADYSNDSMRYLSSLQTMIKTDKLEGLSIHYEDLNANQKNEVILTGFNQKGFQTLDAFTVIDDGITLKYRTIISLEVNGTIDIQTEERSAQYNSGLASNESFNITTEETSTEATDSLDLIQTIYAWKPGQSEYLPISVAKIPGLSIKEDNLKKLYRGDLDYFKEFLHGPWHRVTDQNREKIPFLEEIIHFNPDEGQIIFMMDDIQEIYNWDESYRTTFRNIYIQSSNSLIDSLRRNIIISVNDMDSILIKIQSTTEWGGYYAPVDNSLQQGLIRHETLEPLDELTSLSGLYKSSKGGELYLDYPHFTEKDELGQQKMGVLSFYNLYGESILQIRYQKENGLLEKRVSYSVNYNQTQDSSRIIRTLTLSPGILNASGFVKTPGEYLHYEQIEIMDAN